MRRTCAVIGDIITSCILCLQVQLYELEFLKQQGDKTWLHGVENIPAKLRALCEINKILAHQPWLISARHIEVDDWYMLHSF